MSERRRRRVRADPIFYDRLDLLLPEERGADGTPSRFDFENRDLPALVDLLAADYEGVTQPRPGSSNQRVLVRAGQMSQAVAIYTELIDDEVVMTWISIQPFGED